MRYIELHIHGLDGHVAPFRQVSLGAEVQPQRLFGQPYLAVAGDRSLSVFPAASIVRVDLVADEFPDWDFHMGIRDAIELDEAEFRRESSAVRNEDGGAGSVFADMELANGARVYLELAIQASPGARTQVDFGVMLQRFLSAPSLLFRRIGGGAGLLNPAHLLRVQFYPLPPHVPVHAWHAEPLAQPAGA